MNDKLSDMTLKKAIISAILPLRILIIMTIAGASLNVTLLTAVFATYILGLMMEFKSKILDNALTDGAGEFVGAMIIMLMVGILMSLWMASVTVPAMFYYGLKAVHPTEK